MTTPLEALRRDLSQPLAHPDAATLHELSSLTSAWVVRHFLTLAEQPIGQTASRAQLEARLREPPPEQGREFARVLDEFQQHVAPYACRINHPRFLAFVPSAPTFLSILG